MIHLTTIKPDQILRDGTCEMSGRLTSAELFDYQINHITKFGIDIAFAGFGGMYGRATLDMVHFCYGELHYDDERMLWLVIEQ